MIQDGLMPTRREILAGGAVLALTGGAASAQTGAPVPGQTATARGTVFDADSNPRQGVASVMVSNGLEVVKTAADGTWSLPVRDGDSVFVIKPAGWALPVDPATNLPRFAYVHAPNGSPDLGFRFAGVAPTGPLPASIDFALHRAHRRRRGLTRCCSPIRSRKA